VFGETNLISILQLGTIDYATGLRLQQQLVDLRKQEKIGDVLLLLEHTPVITLGRNAKASNIIASSDHLQKQGVELFETDRGGDVTFHGPGQIVGYPIFDLRGYARVSASAGASSTNSLSSRASRSPSDGDSRDLGFANRKHLGAVDFVRCLEEILIRTCADFSIPTKRICGLTGVWTDSRSGTERVGADPLVRPDESRTRSQIAEEKPDLGEGLKGHDFSRAAHSADREAALAAEENEAKLAAIGVHISRFVTSHGFALNVNTDLSYFNLIIPCGITSKPVTSMQHELGIVFDLNAVAESITRNFGVVFQTQILWLESLDALMCGAGAIAGEKV
jgi:lipoyl(octanoyl) transferase